MLPLPPPMLDAWDAAVVLCMEAMVVELPDLFRPMAVSVLI